MGRTMLLTSQLILRKRALLEKLIVLHPVKKIPRIIHYQFSSQNSNIPPYPQLEETNPWPRLPLHVPRKSVGKVYWMYWDFLMCEIDLTCALLTDSAKNNVCIVWWIAVYQTTRWHNPQDFKPHIGTFLVWSTFPYDPEEYEQVDSVENITTWKSRIYYIIRYKTTVVQNTAPLPSLKWLP
jgi:hypothetical protein